LFAAGEVVRGEAYGEGADVHSFGMLLDSVAANTAGEKVLSFMRTRRALQSGATAAPSVAKRMSAMM
jgi:hypothetical protein